MSWRILVLLLFNLAGCTAYAAYMYKPDLAEQPSDQSKYKADFLACQNQLAAMPDANEPFVPFTLSGYGPAHAGQEEDASDDPQGVINRCMAAKGYRIKQ
jgi:hypothetical protein